VGDLIESAGPEPVKADIPQSPRCDVFFSLKMESYISFLYMEVVVTDLLLRTWIDCLGRGVQDIFLCTCSSLCF
jgi:hypothetical protein